MKDQLSALIDGEFDIDDSEHLIASAKAGGEMKHCWAHYHLIGDAMRGDSAMSHDFSNRVMAALDAEPTVLAPNAVAIGLQVNKRAAYKKSTKLWSVAASVAAVMFVGVMAFQQQFSAPEQLAPVEIAQSVPTEYLQAHQAAAPSSAAYYIQNASFSGSQK
jgi:sigma-E factor negative regulatory protein RseA